MFLVINCVEFAGLAYADCIDEKRGKNVPHSFRDDLKVNAENHLISFNIEKVLNSSESFLFIVGWKERKNESGKIYELMSTGQAEIK